MKQLYIPSRVWTSAQEFIAEFPNLELPLILAYVYPPRSEWDYIRKAETYCDMVRYAISPLSPVSVDIQIDRASLNARVMELNSQTKFLDLLKAAYVYRPIDMPSEDPNWDSAQSIYERQAALPGYIMSWLYIEYFYSDEQLNDSRVVMGMSIAERLRKGLAIFRTVIKDRLIKTLSASITHFRAYTPSQYRDFSESYGPANLSKIPAYSINYEVVGLPPPVDVDYNNVEFWSGVFNHQFGMAILNAVAENLPVKVKTIVTNWKNPDAPYYERTETKDYRTWIFNYVFQDFIIEITENAQILIRYNRGRDSETVTQRKKEAWKKIVMGIALVGAFVGGVALLQSAGVFGAAGSASAVDAGSAAATMAAPVGSAAGATAGATAGAGAGLGGVASGAGATLSSLGATLSGAVAKIGGLVTTGLGILTGVESYKQLKDAGQAAEREQLLAERANDKTWFYLFAILGGSLVAIKFLRGKG